MHWQDVRQLWDPEIVTEGLEVVHEVEATPKRQVGQAGKQIASRMKTMGKGTITMERLQEVFDKPRGELMKQLNAAVDNGFVIETDDGWQVS